MTSSRDTGQPAVAGGLARHIPVLVRSVVEFLSVRDGGVYIDGTFGAGGYSRVLLEAANCRVIAMDRDQTAISAGGPLVEASGGRLTLIEGCFSELDQATQEHVDGVVLDIGVSSMQLDTAERGFSFRLDGPLDMRMSAEGPSAADIVAHATEQDLAAIIATLGEERFARGVARAIVRARAEQPILTTGALSDVVARVVYARAGDIHPATRTFQALRMFVNDELGELARGLAAAEQVLKPGGRLVVVSFHSLEDRLVKSFFTSRGEVKAGSRHLPEVVGAPASFRSLTKRPVVADAAECEQNPRARSAKLRAGERTSASPHAPDLSPLPRLPTLTDVMRRQ